MSCNGCRVLRKGCSDTCVLRSCLQWIQSPKAQGNAVLFLAKFFGRSDIIAFVSAVPETQRPALFQSLLFEACGRTVNPVDGSVGLLARGKWHVCQTAVDTVLAGGTLTPLTEFETITNGIFHDTTCNPYLPFTAFMQDAQPSDPALTLSLGPKKNTTNPWNGYPRALKQRMMAAADTMSSSFSSEASEMTSFGSSGNDQKKVLNLFV
ncbi:LOB domain-containing protein 39-like [Quercus lobata]|uniref:LOB domain-containing protein n=1 Tax=Quercus lobata TaxID=97700 RepID=A0A7N2N887_QUELO|nr:LOB domain-containing protein 39-like [Quercus lobata]